MDCLAQCDEDRPLPRQPSHPEWLGCLIGTDPGHLPCLRGGFVSRKGAGSGSESRQCFCGRTGPERFQLLRRCWSDLDPAPTGRRRRSRLYSALGASSNAAVLRQPGSACPRSRSDNPAIGPLWAVGNGQGSLFGGGFFIETLAHDFVHQIREGIFIHHIGQTHLIVCGGSVKLG